MMVFVHDYDSAIISQTCKICGIEHLIETEPIEVLRFISRVVPDELCFREMNEELRFLLITGICYQCHFG